jgi:hypothetical protein
MDDNRTLGEMMRDVDNLTGEEWSELKLAVAGLTHIELVLNEFKNSEYGTVKGAIHIAYRDAKSFSASLDDPDSLSELLTKLCIYRAGTNRKEEPFCYFLTSDTFTREFSNQEEYDEKVPAMEKRMSEMFRNPKTRDDMMIKEAILTSVMFKDETINIVTPYKYSLQDGYEFEENLVSSSMNEKNGHCIKEAPLSFAQMTKLLTKD